MNANGPELNALSNRIIGCALTSQHARQRFPGKVYENALAHELRKTGLAAEQQRESAHRAQCLNYLHATGMHLCLLMNFGTPRRDSHVACARALAPSRG